MIGAVDMARALTRLLKTPAGQKIAAESAQSDLAKRDKLAAELVRLRARQETEVPPLVRAQEEATEKVRRAATSLRAAESAYRAAALAADTARTSLDTAIAGIEGQLKATASPEIDEFRSELRDLHSATLCLRPGSQLFGVHLNLATGSKVGKVETNVLWIARRLSVITECLLALDALALEPLSEEDVRARLDAMRRSIPEESTDTVDVRVTA